MNDILKGTVISEDAFEKMTESYEEQQKRLEDLARKNRQIKIEKAIISASIAAAIVLTVIRIRKF